MKKKFIKKENNAFTIAEALICFGLMGIIFIATIPSFKVNNNYADLYWSAFNTLLQASKNANDDFRAYFEGGYGCRCSQETLSDCSGDELKCTGTTIQDESGHSIAGPCYNPNQEGGSEPACWTSNLMKQEGVKYSVPMLDHPGFLYGVQAQGDYDGTGTDANFCNLLISRINLASGSSSCQSFIKKSNPDFINKVEPDFKKAFCWNYTTNSSGKITEKKCSKDDIIEPTFVASNGQKFYLSSPVSANLLGTGLTNQNHRKSYRFVVVDLNGEMGPNTQLKKGQQYPDTVLFAINDTGDVIPLGLPEYSKNYINAYVEFPSTITSGATTKKNPYKTSEILTLSKAKQKAWGPTEGDITGVVLDHKFVSNEPFSYSQIFYHNYLGCKSSNCQSHSNKNSMYADNLYNELLDIFLRDEKITTEFSHTTIPGIYEQEGCVNGDSNYCAINFKHQ